MHSIFGLGNPEPRYSLTRHNVGFNIVDSIAQSLGCVFKQGRGEYLIAAGAIEAKKALFVKPMTYMNRSGFAVSQVVHYYNFPHDHMLIVHDDIDLPFGVIRLRPQGRDAGNRGMLSIIEHLGTQEIPRLRFGIRNRDKISDARSYVLARFNRKEQESLPLLIDRAQEAVRMWVAEGIEKTMNTFNRNHLAETQ